MDTSLHTIAQRVDGSGAPIVIVHGAMDRSTSFGRVVRRLRDLTVIRYDRRGYGSSAPGTAVSLDQHVADLISVIGHEPALVLGHSIGGVIAIMAAERHPERVVGVLAYEPPTPWLDWWPADPDTDPRRTPEDEAERFMRKMVGERIWNRLPERTRRARRNEGPAFEADVASIAGPHPPFDPSRVMQPTVCAAGSEATWWHRRGAEELAGALGDAHFTEVAGAGHGVHLTDPGALADLTRGLHTCIPAG